ncbi:MAG: hypothetical protein CMJ42_16610 [Phyllobacteriaceae bacterium]|jgi:hypothetical protein|nr:hypothetical protein [Phyllobacteriaceae bacterium]RMD99755.1 MAG: DUF4290 domain-containing protein [Bacteroidota bacterium]
MEYNSSREPLIIPEYGRNVQNLIKYCKTVEDPKMRQALAERIVVLMSQMNPQSRTMEDYQVRLWKHFFQIADYDIDVTPPIGEKPKPEDRIKKPERVSYPTKDTKFRHYGSNVQKLIAKAISMEDGPKKDAFVEVIASYMKLAYKTWNREHYVSDEMIIEDLEHLSGGKLKVAHNADLDNLHKQLQQQQQQSRRSNNGKRQSGPKHNRGRVRRKRKR